ncbi:hypothetical protein LDJ78_25055, partial [Citrobacter portucalensis]|nr:hypothetical protein [Citrobacter portucalensis]
IKFQKSNKKIAERKFDPFLPEIKKSKIHEPFILYLTLPASQAARPRSAQRMIDHTHIST